ncbi:MAG TPA: DUF2283 domain-containing protein, partial [Nitrosopumilaceae archaeon]|nr:DUF2283 domain-containing protein [Nitrosopumilaceae archaeon]
MKIRYDKSVDALYIEFQLIAPGSARCKELSDEITADYDDSGKLLGMEILDASQFIEKNELETFITKENALIHYVKKVKIVGDHALELTFEDGLTKRVDLTDTFWGELYSPLEDPDFFRQVTLNPEVRTIEW